LNRPELTADRFKRNVISQWSFVNGKFQTDNNPLNLTNHQCPMTNDYFYRTGDLACWLADGTIRFLGRIDKQVKVKGFRIEPGEIECRLMEIDYIKETMVVDIENKKGEKVLCAYVVSGREIDVSMLKDNLARRLPDYMVPAYIIQIEKIPLTPSGKVNRGALPPPGLHKEDGYLAPGNNIEETLIEIWSEVLQIKKEIISVGANFFTLGGHSLTATLMTSRVHKKYDVKIPLAEVFRTPTIQGLAKYIQAAGAAGAVEKERYIPIEPAEKKEYYETSFHQKRLWIIQALDKMNISYNMPAHLQLDHAPDEEALKKSLYKISERHESLRTRFAEKYGVLYQFIEPLSAVEIPFQLIDISALAPQEKEQQRKELIKGAAAAPFDLSKAPLLRVTAIKWEPSRFDILFTMHHIISDGWSMEILQREFSPIYEGYRTGREVVLAPLILQYKDFAQWQNLFIHDPAIKEEVIAAWRKKLEGGLPTLQLPVDAAGSRGDSTCLVYHRRVPGDMVNGLKRLAEDNHTTLTMIMFSIFNILLAHISGQEDIVCSLIGAGRDHLSLHHIVGYFSNSIIMKTHIDPEEDFNELLRRVHAEVMEGFQNRGYPLELILDELKINYPDIPAAFNMLNIPGAPAFEEHEYFQHQEKPQGAKFDLTVFVSEYKDGIGLQWHYKKTLFKPQTIESIAQLYIEFLDNLSQNEGE
jgi:acyl carrier protein